MTPFLSFHNLGINNSVLLCTAFVCDAASWRRSASDFLCIDNECHYSQCMNPEGHLCCPIMVGFRPTYYWNLIAMHSDVAAAIEPDHGGNRGYDHVRFWPWFGRTAIMLNFDRTLILIGLWVNFDWIVTAIVIRSDLNSNWIAIIVRWRQALRHANGILCISSRVHEPDAQDIICWSGLS